MMDLSWLMPYRWAILFYVAVAVIVFLNRGRFEKQGIILLLRTKVGLKLMQNMSERHMNLIRILGLSAIGFAFSGLVFIIYVIIQFVMLYFTTDLQTVGVSPVIPGFPIAGTGLVLPLVVGWICFFVIMVIHEFSHGVVAKAYKIPVKSSGIVFFGPILGAFVEPDEKVMAKRPEHEQYAIFAAGPISNLASVLIFTLIAAGITMAMDSISSVDGISIAVNENSSAALAGLQTGDVIYSINGIPARNATYFDAAAAQTKPGDEVIVGTGRGDFTLVLDSHPSIPFRGYMGISRIENRVPIEEYGSLFWLLKWLNEELFYWLILLSMAIGTINLFPIYITDGARILKLALESAYPKGKAKSYWVTANNICAMLLLLMLLVPLGKQLIG